MSTYAIPGYEFRPRPSIDKLSTCIKSGWVYYGETVDFFEEGNRSRGMQESQRSATRARDMIYLHSQGAAYVLGVGVVFDVAPDSAGNVMFLLETSNVVLNPVNTDV
jgi:hypothetical protein